MVKEIGAKVQAMRQFGHADVAIKPTNANTSRALWLIRAGTPVPRHCFDSSQKRHMGTAMPGLTGIIYRGHYVE
jgi:hypothetical protein